MKSYLFIQLILTLVTIGCAIHFEPGNAYLYGYTTQTTLNEANEESLSGARRPVGYTVTSDLRLSVMWKKSYDYLIKLEVTKSSLQSVSRDGVSTDFPELRRYPVFFHWHGDGKVGRVYLPMNEQTISANIKKGIISMLQIQTVDSERTEVDASGECDVEYQVTGNKVTKSKTNCRNLEKAGQFYHPNKMFDSTKMSLTTSTYEFVNDVITSAHSSDKQDIFLNADKNIDLQVTALQDLKLINTETGGEVVKADSIEKAVEAVDADLDLIGMLLGTDVDSPSCLIDCVSLKEVVKEVASDLQADKISKIESPRAFHKLLPVFRQASQQEITSVLRENKNILPQLLDIAAATQTDSAIEAAIEVLKDETDYRMKERFVMATSFSSHPRESLLNALLEMFKDASNGPELSESVALALGSVTRTFCQVEEQCSLEIVQKIESMFIEILTESKDPVVILKIVRALRNARLHGTTQNLIHLAENSTDNAIIGAAVQALAVMSQDFASINVLDAMGRIYHQNERSYDSGVRTTALAVLLSSRPSVYSLTTILLSTVNQTDGHLGAYVLGMMQDLATHQPEFKEKLGQALNSTRLRNYHTLSPGGKANALTSFLGRSLHTNIPYRLFVQNSQAGIMKKSGMQVNLQTADALQPILLFSIYAQGLESFVDSNAVTEGMEPEDPTAGLALDIMDVLVRPVEFFRGKAALMSAVWSAPSSPVTALALNVITQDKHQTLFLQNGIVLQHDLLGVASIELSGFISISLWNQDAHSILKNSGSTVVTGSLSIAENNHLSASIDFDLSAAAFIDFITDVNFYVTPPQACLRMALDPFTVTEQWTKVEQARGIPKRAKYSITRSKPVHGASYLLSKENSRQCTVLLEK